jgi:hypothetical protein
VKPALGQGRKFLASPRFQCGHQGFVDGTERHLRRHLKNLCGIYVCMYMYICMYVCMYVCVFVGGGGVWVGVGGGGVGGEGGGGVGTAIEKGGLPRRGVLAACSLSIAGSMMRVVGTKDARRFTAKSICGCSHTNVVNGMF